LARSSAQSPPASLSATTAGPCFRSEHYQAEIDHLGIARSPAYHYEPETNGCVEKFIQTLKEQVLWIERFDSFEQLRQAVRDFARLYNHDWLLERHGYLTRSRRANGCARLRPDGRSPRRGRREPSGRSYKLDWWPIRRGCPSPPG
jgi:transposase InsO family protein